MIDDAELIKISLLFNIYEFRCWRDENPQDFLRIFYLVDRWHATHINFVIIYEFKCFCDEEPPRFLYDLCFLGG